MKKAHNRKPRTRQITNSASLPFLLYHYLATAFGLRLAIPIWMETWEEILSIITDKRTLNNKVYRQQASLERCLMLKGLLLLFREVTPETAYVNLIAAIQGKGESMAGEMAEKMISQISRVTLVWHISVLRLPHKYHRTGGLNNRNLVLQTGNPRYRCLEKSPPPRWRWPPPHCMLLRPFLRACQGELVSPYLMISFNFNCLL